MSEASVVFESRPFGFGVCEELTLPFVCRMAPGSQSERKGVRAGMRVMSVGDKDVSTLPPQFVKQILIDAKLPAKVRFVLNPDWVLDQKGPCSCEMWRAIVAAFRREAERDGKRASGGKRPLDGKKVHVSGAAAPASRVPKDGKRVQGGAESVGQNTDKRAVAAAAARPPPSRAQQLQEFVVVDARGLKLLSSADAKATVIGRYALGSRVLGRGSLRSGFVELVKPYQGYCATARGGVRVLGLPSDIRRLGDVLEASLPHVLRVKSDHVWSDLGDMIYHYDSMSKHVLILLAQKGIKIDRPTVELIVDYAREGVVSAWARGSFAEPIVAQETRLGRPSVLFFYSKSVPDDLLRHFSSFLEAYLTKFKGKLGIYSIEVTGRGGSASPRDGATSAATAPAKPVKTSPAGVLHYRAPVGLLGGFGLHRFPTGEVFHMCVLDETGRVIQNTWPQSREIMRSFLVRYRWMPPGAKVVGSASKR